MQRLRLRRWWIVTGVSLILASLFGFVGLPQAQAASKGCEHYPVAGHDYYQCTVIASHGLNVRNATSFAIEGGLPYGATIYVVRQIRHTVPGVIHGGPIWDVLQCGQVVDDSWLLFTFGRTVSLLCGISVQIREFCLKVCFPPRMKSLVNYTQQLVFYTRNWVYFL